MKTLAEFKCVACRGDTSPLSAGEIADLLPEVPAWELIEDEGIQRLERVFPFRDFSEGLEFANRVGTIAESEEHHPKMTVEWGRVTIQWWTYAIGGLHMNDFVMAAKTDQL